MHIQFIFDLHGFTYKNHRFRFTRFSLEPIFRVNRGIGVLSKYLLSELSLKKSVHTDRLLFFTIIHFFFFWNSSKKIKKNQQWLKFI